MRMLDSRVIERTLASPAHDDVSADDYLREQSDTVELWRLVERLPKPDQDIIDMRYRHGKTYADIGAIFGINAASTRSRVALARSKVLFLSKWSGTSLTESDVLSAAPIVGDREARMLWLYLQTANYRVVAPSFGLSVPSAWAALRKARMRLARSDGESAARIHAALHELLAVGRWNIFGAKRDRSRR